MSYYCFTYHIIWRTYRSELTIDERYERHLYNYLFGICKEKGCVLYRINSMPDHVHICLAVKPSISVSDFMQVLKQESSKWMKEHEEWFPDFKGWGKSFGAFTYSLKDRPVIVEYIKNQKSHHKKETFPEEYERILTEFGFNPKEDPFFLLDE